MTTSLKKSQRQEKKAAARHGGTVNSGSGNGWVRKNDVRTPDYSFEFKYTDKKSYSLKEDDLVQMEKYALIDGRTAIFGVSFGGRGNWLVMREEDFLHITGGDV